MPAPTVQPTLVIELENADGTAVPTVSLELTWPYARPPVAYSSTVGDTRIPARPRTVPNQSIFWVKTNGIKIFGAKLPMPGPANGVNANARLPFSPVSYTHLRAHE